MVYSAILIYNKFPEKVPSLTDKDILKAQMALDDYVNILKSADVNVNIQFNMDEIFKDNSD